MKVKLSPDHHNCDSYTISSEDNKILINVYDEYVTLMLFFDNKTSTLLFQSQNLVRKTWLLADPINFNEIELLVKKFIDGNCNKIPTNTNS